MNSRLLGSGWGAPSGRQKAIIHAANSRPEAFKFSNKGDGEIQTHSTRRDVPVAAWDSGVVDLQRERAFMRLAARPQNIKESIALAAGLVPTPLMDTLMALLLAKTVIAATALGIFDALEAEPLTSSEIAEILGSDPKATEQMARALFGCRYLKYKENRFALAPISRRWLSRS